MLVKNIFLCSLIMIASSDFVLAQASNAIQLRTGGGSAVVTASTSGSVTLELPSTSGSTGQVLITNGSGKLSWSTGARSVPVTVTGTTGTVQETHRYVIVTSGSPCTLTLPAAADYPGRELTIKSINGKEVLSAGSNVVPINSTVTTNVIVNEKPGGWGWALLVSDGTNWVVMQRHDDNPS